MKGIVISTQEREKTSKIQDYPLQDYYYIPVLETLYISPNSSVTEGDKLTYCPETDTLYHSPVSGIITTILNLNQKAYIEIKRDTSIPNPVYPLISPQGLPAELLINRIKKAGIVQYNNLEKARGKVKYLIINGLETDIFISTNQQLLEEKIREIIQTAFQLKFMLRAVEVIIVITKNTKLKNHIESFLLDHSIKLIEVPKMYPLSEEKQLIKHLFDIELQKNHSSIDHQLIVLNVATVVAIYDALFYQKPLTEKIISLEGAYSLMHGNFRVKLGTPISAFMRPFSAENSYVMFSGGPITGQSLDKEKSLLKHMDAIMIFEGRPQAQETYCISCNLCNDHCPIRLEPIKLVDYIKHREYSLAEDNYISECIFCNICTYVCPSFIPIGNLIKDYINTKSKQENPHA